MCAKETGLTVASFEDGMRRPQAQECRRHLEAEGGKETASPLEAPEGPAC